MVLLAAPVAVLDCFTSSSTQSPVDAGLDSTQPGADSALPESGGDVGAEPAIEASIEAEAAVEAAVDAPVDAPASVADAQDAQPEAVAEAEAGPPVVEAIAQGLISPLALAVDASFIYFLESATPADDSGYTGGIRRCPIGGCGAGAPTVVVAAAVLPGGMALSGSTLFWSNAFNSILSCDVSTVPCTGTTFLANIVDDAGNAAFPAPLWVNGSNLYWLEELGGDRAIETCPVTGCTSGYPKVVLYAGAGTMLSGGATSGLAIDGSFAYVSLFTGGPILRYAMTSAEVADVTTETALGSSPTPYGAHDLDVDGTTLRWAESSGTRVAGCTTPGCNPVVDVATGRVVPYAVRHDATYVYGANQGASLYAGVLWRLHK